MTNVTQFIGSKISLVSKAEIRYEGILYTLDAKAATISLAKVRAFGTEDRPTERPIPPRDDVYDFIIFRGADIKSIDVLEPPKQASEVERGVADPAIIEISNQNSRSSFPRFSGPAGTQQPRQQRQNRNLIEGLLRQTRQGNESQQGGDRSSSVEDALRERERDGRFRGGRGGRREQYPDFRGRRDFNFSPRGGGWGGRGGYRRPQGMFRPPQSAKVTFEQDFDFEKANEELMSKIKEGKPTAVVVAVEAKEEGANPDVAADNQENREPAIFYNKGDFFDTISCEALERAKGTMSRPDWRKEVKLNAETFGLSGQRRGFYRGGGGGFFNGGYDNRWGYAQRGGYNNWYGGPGSRQF